MIANPPVYPCSFGLGSSDIDLCNGCIRDAESGQIKHQFTRFKYRARLISSHLYLATASGLGGLDIFDIVTLWPQWIDQAVSLRDLRSQPDQLRIQINKSLKPFGWCVTTVSLRSCTKLTPINGTECRQRLRVILEDAVPYLKNMEAALKNRDYPEAVTHATRVLQYHSQNRAASQVITAAAFSHDVWPQDERVLLQAITLTCQYRDVLRKAAAKLLVLYERESEKKGRPTIPEAVRRFEERLQVLEPISLSAEGYLQRRLGAQEGEK